MLVAAANRSGGLTVYCFGDPAKMSDESVRLSLRIHDEVSRLLLDVILHGEHTKRRSVTEATFSDQTSALAARI